MDCMKGDAVLIPDFDGITAPIKPEVYKAALNALEGVPEDKRETIIIETFTSRPVQYEKFFCDGEFYRILWEMRVDIKKQRKIVSSCLNTASTISGKVLKNHMLSEPKKALQEAVDNILYAIKFYDLLLDHADKWFEHYGVNARADPEKHPCWDDIIFKCLNSIENQGIKQTEACRMTAELLVVFYPQIWGKDSLYLISERIRQRKYRKDVSGS